MQERRYRLGESTLTVMFGDITKSSAQAIVSSDDHYLTMGGGVSGSILRAGGNSIALDASKKVPAALGDVVVTTAGSLAAQYVFHAITIAEEESDPKTVVRRAIVRCLQLVDAMNLQSIAFPAIGAGAAGFAYEDVAAQMADVIATNLQARTRPIGVEIHLLDRFRRMQPIDFIRFFEEFSARAPRLAQHELAAGVAITSPAQPILSSEPHSEEDLKSRRVNHVRRLVSKLEEQRSILEERLVDLLGSASPQIEEIRSKLGENEQLRLGYLSELRTLLGKEIISAPQSTALPRRVFVSSTWRDLQEHRAAIKEKIIRRDLLFRGMEHFGADPENRTPSIKIVDEVKAADIYCGVFGVRYGSIDSATGVSMTELELNAAEASGKPMLIYVIDEDAHVKVSDIEPSPEGRQKLEELRKRLLSKYVAYMFKSPDDLSQQVYADLGKLQSGPAPTA